jgi:hypothetical protein
VDRGAHVGGAVLAQPAHRAVELGRQPGQRADHVERAAIAQRRQRRQHRDPADRVAGRDGGAVEAHAARQRRRAQPALDGQHHRRRQRQRQRDLGGGERLGRAPLQDQHAERAAAGGERHAEVGGEALLAEPRHQLEVAVRGADRHRHRPQALGAQPGQPLAEAEPHRADRAGREAVVAAHHQPVAAVVRFPDVSADHVDAGDRGDLAAHRGQRDLERRRIAGQADQAEHAVDRVVAGVVDLDSGGQREHGLSVRARCFRAVSPRPGGDRRPRRWRILAACRRASP